MATIFDVASKAGVSTATVSHVINKTRKVNPDTLARVEQAIRELDYQPNAQARTLKTGKSGLFGVLNYFSVDDYFSEILCSLEAAANDAGYNVLLRHSEPYGCTQENAIVAWTSKNIDGLIINSPMVTDALYETLRKLGCPCVLLHIDDPGCACDTINVNDREISKETVQYLISLGHRRIACISGRAYPHHTAAYRKSGYLEALQEAGLPTPPEYIVETDYRMHEGFEKCLQLLDLPQPPTAIFTYSDLLAIGAIRAAKDRGLSVPEDLSVVGFDDVELASYTTPRLTTILQDKDRIGRLAVECVLHHIENPDLLPQRIELPTRLILRESTAPPAQR